MSRKTRIQNLKNASSRSADAPAVAPRTVAPKPTAAERLQALAQKELRERQLAVAQAVNEVLAEHGFTMEAVLTITSNADIRGTINFIPTR